MADILIDNEGLPGSNPTSGKSILFVETTNKTFTQLDDLGLPHGVLYTTGSTAAQGAITTTEVYLTGSSIQIPSYGMKTNMIFHWDISVVKTAAGVAAPVWTWRIGPNKSTGDTSRLALTATGIQVATAFDGILTAMVRVHSVSASGVIAGSGGSGPNFGGGGSGVSAGFDNTATIAGQFIGLSVTTGASAAWTVNAVSAYLIG
jgi:hypothetical protein